MAHLTPTVDPAHFDDFDGFRETFLANLTAPGDALAVRRAGYLFATVATEHRQYWPDAPERYPRGELRAALADLRYLQGYLSGFLGVHPFAVELGESVRETADRLDAALRTRRRF